MSDPFSLATGVISLVAMTLQTITGLSRMLDKTITAHRAADEELERLRRNLEELSRRMECNHGKLSTLASNTKDRGFKKLLQSDAGQAAVVRLCQALKETHRTLKRFTDQSESEEATLRANALPSTKRSLAFVRAVLKYNVSPQTIDEMISNLRGMQTEVQDCLRNLETSFSDVGDFLDIFHRQIVQAPTAGSLYSTSTTLTARVLLVGWLEKFVGRRGSSDRSQNESRTLHNFLQADQDEDEPPLPLNRAVPPTLLQATEQWTPPRNTNPDTGTSGSNVGDNFVPGFTSSLIRSMAHESDAKSVASDDSNWTSVSMSDDELALFGAPWAKEGMLCRKQYWERAGKRAKNNKWMDVFAVAQKGQLSMFVFGGSSSGDGGDGSGLVGGGNWANNANLVGEYSLSHSSAYVLPPPGIGKRPHCFVLVFADGEVYFVQASTEELAIEWISTCKYWAARQSEVPLPGAVPKMEYGWSRVEAGVHAQDNFYTERIYIEEWKTPMPNMRISTLDEEGQLESLRGQIEALEEEMKEHNAVKEPMTALYPPKSANLAKAVDNWEKRSTYLLTELIKYHEYFETLKAAMELRLKRIGEKALEKALAAGK